MTPLVMVSDDELLLAKMLVRQAKAAGMRAFCDTSSRAPELAERYHPDLILMDVNQRIDGRKLLADLKTNQQTSDIPVVMISGLDDEATRSSCLSLGATNYVLKPFRKGFFDWLAREAKAGSTDDLDAASAPIAAPSPRSRVLLVGADATYAHAASMLSCSHLIDRVQTLAEAREATLKQRYHVLCTDLVGSGAEGVQFVQWARANDPVTRGVLLGDSAQYAMAAKLDDSCCCTMLLKPYGLERLAEEIDRAARLALHRAELEPCRRKTSPAS